MGREGSGLATCDLEVEARALRRIGPAPTMPSTALALRRPPVICSIARCTCLAVLLVLVVGCGSSGARRAPSETPPEWTNDPTPLTVARRVIAYDPRGRGDGTLLILVNEGNPDRATPEGQQRIALSGVARGSHGYKVLSERRMDELLAALEVKGFSRRAQPFVAGDERFFGQTNGDRFRGIVFVEIGEQRSKVVGYRPMGGEDLVGRAAFDDFNEVKGTVLVFSRDQDWTEVPHFRIR